MRLTKLYTPLKRQAVAVFQGRMEWLMMVQLKARRRLPTKRPIRALRSELVRTGGCLRPRLRAWPQLETEV